MSPRKSFRGARTSPRWVTCTAPLSGVSAIWRTSSARTGCSSARRSSRPTRRRLAGLIFCPSPTWRALAGPSSASSSRARGPGGLGDRPLRPVPRGARGLPRDARGGSGFEPAHPVAAAAVRGVEGIEPDVYISDPATGGCSELFNAVYELLLQMIARYFAFGHETREERQVLAHAAVGLMFQAIKPLGLLLAALPAGPDHPGARPEPTSSSPTGPASCSRTASLPGSASPSGLTNWPPSPRASSRRREQTWWRRCHRR